MSKRMYRLIHEAARAGAIECIRTAPVGYVATIAEPTRSLDQNSLMWPLLACLADQIEWHGQKLSPQDWKDMLTSTLRKQRVAPGIDGGFVVFGERTKTYTKAQLSELIELIYAFGTEHGVNFNEQKG